MKVIIVSVLFLFLLSPLQGNPVQAQDTLLPFKVMVTGTADEISVIRATEGRIDVIVDEAVWDSFDLDQGIAEFNVPFDRTCYLTLVTEPFGTFDQGVRITFNNGVMQLDRNIGGVYDGNVLFYRQMQDGNFTFDWMEQYLWVTSPAHPDGPILGPTYLMPGQGVQVNGLPLRAEDRFIPKEPGPDQGQNGWSFKQQGGDFKTPQTFNVLTGHYEVDITGTNFCYAPPGSPPPMVMPLNYPPDSGLVVVDYSSQSGWIDNPQCWVVNHSTTWGWPQGFPPGPDPLSCDVTLVLTRDGNIEAVSNEPFPDTFTFIPEGG